MAKEKDLFSRISNLNTEQRNPNSMEIDSISVSKILKIINKEDKKVSLAVEKELPRIEKAVNLVVKSIRNGGRLLYFGAGTSGRLGVLDAVECPPTFGTLPGLIQGFIAGGKKAMFQAKEGAEDLEKNGADDVLKANVTKNDVICGIAASSRTPYVKGALEKGKKLGANTIFINSIPRFNQRLKDADVLICLDVGPEVLMGSTRMKSGTAQKLVLNMITTASMIRLGKVYENMMIDLQLKNNKLVERAKRIIMTITGVTYEEAAKYLNEANGHVKTALVMIKANVNAEEAKQRLYKSNGIVRKAIDNCL